MAASYTPRTLNPESIWQVLIWVCVETIQLWTHGWNLTKVKFLLFGLLTPFYSETVSIREISFNLIKITFHKIPMKKTCWNPTKLKFFIFRAPLTAFYSKIISIREILLKSFRINFSQGFRWKKTSKSEIAETFTFLPLWPRFTKKQ